MHIDRNGMRVLSREECFRRLGRAGIGRLAVTVGALPATFPINYAVHDDDVYFRSAPGSKLAASSRNAVVAFEVDEVDRISHLGWSVEVVEPASTVVDVGREITRDEDRALAGVNTMPLSVCPECGSDRPSCHFAGQPRVYVAGPGADD